MLCVIFIRMTPITPYLILCFQYIVAYPISRGTMINFVAFKSQHDLENSKHDGPWVCSSEKSEFMTIFRGWEPEVQALLDVRQDSMDD